jgi:hypothetical protein
VTQGVAPNAQAQLFGSIIAHQIATDINGVARTKILEAAAYPGHLPGCRSCLAAPFPALNAALSPHGV